jgi:hypothetical protein
MLIPRPTQNEPEEPDVSELSSGAYIKWYLDVPNWKCNVCHAVMFGRMTYCVYCKVRLGKDTPRP